MFVIVGRHELLKDPIYYSGVGCGWTLLAERAMLFDSRSSAKESGIEGKIINY